MLFSCPVLGRMLAWQSHDNDASSQSDFFCSTEGRELIKLRKIRGIRIQNIVTRQQQLFCVNVMLTKAWPVSEPAGWYTSCLAVDVYLVAVILFVFVCERKLQSRKTFQKLQIRAVRRCDHTTSKTGEFVLLYSIIRRVFLSYVKTKNKTFVHFGRETDKGRAVCMQWYVWV